MERIKIAIHHRATSFSKRWIAYCEKKGIPYKIVNCYDDDIISQLQDCDALMWHHHQAIFKDVLIARRILFAIEQAGIKVFPNFNSGWHFDDKVGQKYLLEAIHAPLVKSYVFYDKRQALAWVEKTSFPKVFKLSGGAGSANVKLIKSESQARRIINRAFGKGFEQYDRIGGLKDRIKKYKVGIGTFFNVLKGVVRLINPPKYSKLLPREKGYVYFQEFIPNNNFDVRVIVIGNRAFAVKRYVRENDFRASGSGVKSYDKQEIDERCIKIAFDINKKLHSQSIGYDFVFDQDNNPLIVEIGYGFAIEFYDPCPGYWDLNMKWHQGNFIPQEWMVENLINDIQNKYT